MERESRASAAAAGGARRWEAPSEDVIVVSTGRPPRPLLMDGVAAGAGAGQQQQYPELPERVYFKTKLCEKYVTTGRCMYEEGCTFAHGHAELRPPLPLPGGPWRRPLAEQEHSRIVGRGNAGKVCFMFRENGNCHYGDKCAFPHASAPGQEMRNLHGEPKLMTEARRSAPPPSMAFPVAAAAAAVAGRGYAPGPSRAFQPAVPVRELPEEDGGKVTRLMLLSRRKTSGIYGDWPEGL